MANANKSLAKRSKYLLIFGFLFFINPIPLGLDLLPDLFGCILIYFGLTQLAYFDGAVEKARRMSLYMMIVEFIKLLLTKSIYLTEIGSNRMLGVTAFSMVEIVLYIIFFKQLFDGISYFSMRNNFNQTMAKCDGCAFLSNLSVVAKITASLLPELLALLEMRKNITTDFKTVELINDVMITKPLLVVLLSVIAFVACAAWYFSMVGFIRILHSEAGNELDARYISEYSSKPRLVRPKKLKNASLVTYVAIFFLVDVKVDGFPVAPIWATFLFLFIAAFFYGELKRFSGLKLWSAIAFVLMIGANIFKSVYVPYGAIVIQETPLWVVAVNVGIAVLSSFACLMTVRTLLCELSELSLILGGEAVPITLPWVAFSTSTVLWAVGYAVPYLYSYVAFWRLAAAALFIWQTASIITRINDEEAYRASLEDVNDRS